MSEISFCCKGCGAKLRVKQEYAGRKAKCPKCGQSSTVTVEKSRWPQTQVVVAEDVGPGRANEAFGVKLAKAFGYPFKGSGIVLLLVATGCLVVLELLSWLLPLIRVIKLFFGWYLCAYYISVIGSSADGEAELPDWPGVTDLRDDIVRPVFLFAGTALASWGPLIFYTIWFADTGVQKLVVYGFIGWGLLYFPMGLLAVAVFDSLNALNPLLIIGAIVKIPLRYLLVCVLFFAVYYVGSVLVAYLEAIPVVGLVVTAFFVLYAAMVAMRILGLIYLANAKKLGWFE